ncbi:efflux RND transporter periplasmic adaptor subunit [Sulfurimonas sp.]|uniref:efflux RND transporter periplasmic adaptor subunit n=1 Tax=Sulfurimonas sp. TaxID=2022749 RepID=UPI002617D5FC|nr:efflux RND transporter periplasmic adaptor subunit [Sulfurimonas sp.]
MKYLFLLLFSFGSLVAQELILTGTVISNNKKMIPARYMGYVKKINFEVGDSVEREDTLFELESAEFDILESQANLALEQANLMLDMYKTRVNVFKKRKHRLKRKKSMMPAMDFRENMEDLNENIDDISGSIEAAKVLVTEASEKTKQFATIAGYLKIKAPNDGVIVERRIQVGDMVAPGMLTMIIVDMKHLEIEAEVAESDLKYLRRNKVVKITIPSLDYKASGFIKAIVPSANPMAHTFKIRVSFEKTSDMIFPGMYAKIYIDLTDELANKI